MARFSLKVAFKPTPGRLYDRCRYNRASYGAGVPPCMSSLNRAEICNRGWRLHGVEADRLKLPTTWLQVLTKVVPVDVYIGMSPRPEAMFYGLMQLQRRIKVEKTTGDEPQAHAAGFFRENPEIAKGTYKNKILRYGKYTRNNEQVCPEAVFRGKRVALAVVPDRKMAHRCRT